MEKEILKWFQHYNKLYKKEPIYNRIPHSKGLILSTGNRARIEGSVLRNLSYSTMMLITSIKLFHTLFTNSNFKNFFKILAISNFFSSLILIVDTLFLVQYRKYSKLNLILPISNLVFWAGKIFLNKEINFYLGIMTSIPFLFKGFFYYLENDFMTYENSICTPFDCFRSLLYLFLIERLQFIDEFLPDKYEEFLLRIFYSLICFTFYSSFLLFVLFYFQEFLKLKKVCMIYKVVLIFLFGMFLIKLMSSLVVKMFDSDINDIRKDIGWIFRYQIWISFVSILVSLGFFLDTFKDFKRFSRNKKYEMIFKI